MLLQENNMQVHLRADGNTWEKVSSPFCSAVAKLQQAVEKHPQPALKQMGVHSWRGGGTSLTHATATQLEGCLLCWPPSCLLCCDASSWGGKNC